MTREEAIDELSVIYERLSHPEDCERGCYSFRDGDYLEAIDMAIEALKNEPILCEECRHRNTWDNPRFEPQYYRCGKGIKFRDYGYVREDDYCPFGKRREESEVEE